MTLIQNNIFEEYYSGFRKHHSTETALTCIADQILINMSKRMVIPTIIMDLSKTRAAISCQWDFLSGRNFRQ